MLREKDEPLLEFRKVSIEYKSTNFTLDKCTFKVSKGIYGLVGPNGAGKSTIIKLILGLMKPQKGEIVLNGNKRDIFSITQQRLLGFLHAHQSYPDGFTGREYLEYISHLYKLDENTTRRRIRKFASLFNIQDHLDKKISRYSSGQAQKLGLIQSFINEKAKLIILDEPTSNLDPSSRITLQKIVLNAYENSKSFLISSHSLLELKEICTHFYFLSDGKMIFEIEKDNIKDKNIMELYHSVIQKQGKRGFNHENNKSIDGLFSRG